MDVLGIDIAKAKFDVALYKNKKLKFKKFNNSLGGFQDLDLWLKKHNVSDLHACMEATGNYGESLALYLHDTRHQGQRCQPSWHKGLCSV
jgi:transposase